MTNITLCIKIQIHQAPKKDRLNPSFVKDLGVVSGKMAKNGHKMVIYFFSYKFEKKWNQEKIVFYIIVFDPIRI